MFGTTRIPGQYAYKERVPIIQCLSGTVSVLHYPASQAPDAPRYFRFLLPRMPPVFSVADFCIAPFAASPATLPISGTNVGFDVVP
jgi:hypothetical protein